MAPKRKLADTDSDVAGSPASAASVHDRASEHPSDSPQQLQQEDTAQQQPAASPQQAKQASEAGHFPFHIDHKCNLCRFRKTKCDALRPTCGFCAGLGVQCQYRESANTSAAPKESRSRAPVTKASHPRSFKGRSSAAAQDDEKNVSRLEKRLLELESKWAELEKQKLDAVVTSAAPFMRGSPNGGLVVRPASTIRMQPPPAGSCNSSMMALPAMLGGPSPPASATDIATADFGNGTKQAGLDSCLVGADSISHHQRQGSIASSTATSGPTGGIVSSQYGVHSKKTTRGQFTARPSLLTFECPPYVPSESYDDSGEFYDSEMAAGDDFKRQMAQCLAVFPDVSKRTVRLVLQKFVENFLGWMPLFEPTAVYTVVHAACASGFAPSDPNSCLAMFILATGTLLQNHSDIRSNPLPGLDYFSHGSRLLERFTFTSSSLTTLHCRILQSAYFKLTLHPLLSWNVIMQGTRDCMNVLSTRWFKSLDPSETEPWHRAFWACSIMSDEFEASLRMYTIGHRLYHEIVPLPRFENEDTGFYYFLAQISLRKLVCDTLDVVGYHDGRVVYAPLVTTELRNQAAEWHRHLPVAIRFPLDNTPLFDARKSFLRLQYFSLQTVLEWASVLKVMEAYSTDRENTDDIALARIEATECFRCCALYLEVAAEQLLGWQLGTSISLWTTFAFVAMMIVTHKAPALAFIPTTRDESHIRSAIDLLRPWTHLPYVANSLARMTILMERSGMT
ncbi:hypothetical protein SEUCBS139899_008943 [Sporothrix eucalyptigena]|uniref:Zn(2)-C6 fungal-type domain-containing protein n=1 Tax=Sporothrix eucalyptigena TaxID=1812306 RepID=A0ABP0CKV2_9PEZI